MYREHDFSYGERDGAQLVRLPYEGTSLAMYVVLPEEGGVPSALQALAQEGMAYFDGMKIGPDVHLTLPKFSLTYGGSLLDGLRARGVLVRWWADEPIRDWLRVSIGTDEEMRALVGALKELI